MEKNWAGALSGSQGPECARLDEQDMVKRMKEILSQHGDDNEVFQSLEIERGDIPQALQSISRALQHPDDLSQPISSCFEL